MARRTNNKKKMKILFNKLNLIILIIMIYVFYQFYDWFTYSSLISLLKERRNPKITEIENKIEKKNDVINLLRIKNNNISILEYEKNLNKIIKFLPDKKTEIGYITDYKGANDSDAHFMFTQYVLSPYIIKLSSKKKFIIGNFSEKIVKDRIISKKEYVFCEENETTRNYNELVYYSQANKEIKKKFPKNKIIIYSPSLKRSGKKIKKYNCLNRKDFLIKKEFKILIFIN